MTSRTRTVGMAIAAAMAFTSLPAGAQMYKWTDEAGSVTYSNIPPPEPAKVNDVTRIDDTNTATTDQRPKAAQPAVPAEVNASRAPQPEAVQDPCLRSADPHCYQRNKEKYHPYMGYAPATARSPVTGAIGASASPAGTGAIGGQVGPAPAAEKRVSPGAVVAPPIDVRTK